MPNGSRAHIVRNPKRGHYERETIYAILDAGFLCHVGFVVNGEARVLPTAFVRIDDAVYLHGHLRNQMLQALLDGQVACITVTLLDGLVLARSGFHHSVNYRSAVIFGQGGEVIGDEKAQVLDALIDHLVPGRSGCLRAHTDQELNATLVIKFPITEASAKIRSGPPGDPESDYELDIWAGVLNLNTVVSKVDECPRLNRNIKRPTHIDAYLNE